VFVRPKIVAVGWGVPFAFSQLPDVRVCGDLNGNKWQTKRTILAGWLSPKRAPHANILFHKNTISWQGNCSQ